MKRTNYLPLWWASRVTILVTLILAGFYMAGTRTKIIFTPFTFTKQMPAIAEVNFALFGIVAIIAVFGLTIVFVKLIVIANNTKTSADGVIGAGIGWVIFGVIGAVIGWVIFGVIGAVIGAVIGLIIFADIGAVIGLIIFADIGAVFKKSRIRNAISRLFRYIFVPNPEK